MHLRMHTKCIQNAYKHIKSKKGREFFFYFFLYCPFLRLLLPAIYRQSSSTVCVFGQSSTNRE